MTRTTRRKAGEGLFHASFSLGRVAGVSIGVNWSWLLVLVLVTLSLATTVFPEQSPGLSRPAYVVMAVAAAVLFFACLLLHELGHAVVARREGMEIDGITLWVFGGVARFKGVFPSAGAEFRIAIAGPLVTLVLCVVLIAATLVLPAQAWIEGVVAWLGWMNLILLAFNMLPALPLDGGRVLRSALWHRMGDFTRATRIAGGLGRAFGHALIVGGVLLFVMGVPGGLWFAFIGWFLAVSAQAEAQLAELREVLDGLRVRDAMVVDPIAVPGAASIDAFMTLVFAGSRHTAYPVAEGGLAAGVIDVRAAAAIPSPDRATRRVRDVMAPLADVVVLAPDQPLFAAAVELMQSQAGRGVVVAGGRLVGLLTVKDLSRLLEMSRLAGGRPVAPHRTAAC